MCGGGDVCAGGAVGAVVRMTVRTVARVARPECGGNSAGATTFALFSISIAYCLACSGLVPLAPSIIWADFCVTI